MYSFFNERVGLPIPCYPYYISVWQEWTFENTTQIMLLPCLKSSNGLLSHAEKFPTPCPAWAGSWLFSDLILCCSPPSHSPATPTFAPVHDHDRLLSLPGPLLCSSLWFSQRPCLAIRSKITLPILHHILIRCHRIYCWYFSRWFCAAYSSH